MDNKNNKTIKDAHKTENIYKATNYLLCIVIIPAILGLIPVIVITVAIITAIIKIIILEALNFFK